MHCILEPNVMTNVVSNFIVLNFLEMSYKNKLLNDINK